MQNYGWSPIPTGPFGQIGQALGGLGQSASQWLPMLAQMMYMREQSGRNQLNTIMQMPGLPEEAKRRAIEDYSKEWGTSPFGVKWPKVPIPGPVTQPAQPAVTAPMTITVGGADLDVQSQRAAQAQAGRPEVTVVPAQPEVRGPSTGERYYVPPSALTVGDVVNPQDPVWANMPPALRDRLSGLPLDQATRIPGLGERIGQSLGLGGDFDRPVASLGEHSAIVAAVKKQGFDPTRVTIREAMSLPGVSDVFKRAIQPPVDVTQLVTGTIIPGKEQEAAAVGARAQAAIQAGTLTPEQGAAMLQPYYRTPDQQTAAHEKERGEYQIKLAGALADKKNGPAMAAQIQAEMAQNGYSQGEINAVTQAARENAPMEVRLSNGQTITLPAREAAGIIEQQHHLAVTMKQHRDDMWQRHLDRDAALRNAQMGRADNKWLTVGKGIADKLAGADAQVARQQGIVGSYEYQIAEADAIIKAAQVRGSQVPAEEYARAVANKTSAEAALVRAKAELAAAQAAQKVQQQRWDDHAATDPSSMEGKTGGPTSRPGGPTSRPGGASAEQLRVLGPPERSAGKVKTLSDGTKWRSDGKAWTQVQ